MDRVEWGKKRRASPRSRRKKDMKGKGSWGEYSKVLRPPKELQSRLLRMRVTIDHWPMETSGNTEHKERRA